MAVGVPSGRWKTSPDVDYQGQETSPTVSGINALLPASWETSPTVSGINALLPGRFSH